MDSSSNEENTEANKIDKSLAEEHEITETFEEFEGAASGKTDGEIKESRERKLTEKGRQYQKELLDSKRKAASTKLRQKIEKIRASINSKETSWVILQLERDGLDQIKEEFNDAHHAFHEFLENEEEREASYRWFDVQDRECMECRIKLTELIYSVERAHSNSKPKSVASGLSKTSQNTRKTVSSKSSVNSKRIEAATRKAKLEVEMKFLEQELELRRLQLMKDISLANAEEDAMKRILEEDTKSKPISDRKQISGVERNEDHDDNAKRSEVDLSPPPLISKSVPKPGPSVTRECPEVTHGNDSPKTKEKHSLNDSNAIRELINLQEKQTQLSALIANQQKISSLPVQEPPIFNGNILDYPSFVQAFEATIENRVDSNKDRLFFLNKYTSGKANEAIKGFVTLNTDDGYNEAKALLAERFGNPYNVAEKYKSQLRQWPKVRDGDSAGIQDLSDFLIRCREVMKSMRYLNELNSTETLIQVSAKLPSYSGVKWCRHARDIRAKTKNAVTFSNLVEFVKEEAELATDPVFSPNNLRRERNKESNREGPSMPFKGRTKRPPSANSLLTSTGGDAGQKSVRPSARCLLCQGNHSLEECVEYTKRSVQERVAFLRSKGACFGCLEKGHLSKTCGARLNCKKCSKFHPTSLHEDSKNKKEPPKEGDAVIESGVQAVSNCASTSDFTTINSMILPVWLHHKDRPETEVLVYALLDNASDTTFIKTSTLKELGVEGPELKLKLYTMHGNAEIPVQKVDGLVVERFDKKVKIELPKSYSRDSIPSRRNQIPRSETASMWPHLQRIENKIPPYQEQLEVGILIGCNCPRAIKPREVITGKGDDPYAIRTLLGWGIIGPVIPVKELLNDVKNEEIICHRIITQEIGDIRRVDSKFVIDAQAKEIINPYQVKEMFELDFSERNIGDQALSQEDRRFLARVKESIRHRDDSHYEMPLPFKDPNTKLPNNRMMALHRLNHLKRRFASDAKYRNDYVTFMNTVIQSGYAEKVPTKGEGGNESNQQVWYIPHHGVYHPKKPNKIRVVFDCSAEFKGESLNKHLLQGPDMTNNLTGVLCRFRKEPVALMCDVEGMFHQVKVSEECRDLLRFLWWENGDTSSEPKEFRMTVHLFGATSSPGCSNFALKSTANDNEEEIGSAAANFLREDFYVDDGLKSVPSVHEAVKLIKDVKEMCKRGGFNLHKFTSNSKEVIHSIPVQDRAEDIKNLDLDQDILPIERALGIQWCIENDSFNFRITLKDKPCTRRGILSTVSSIFDPLGFVAPVLLEGKKILQELCKEDTGWDDPVPAAIKVKWEKWRSELHLLQEFSVARCYKPKNFGHVTKTELHHFSDASNKGYGQCSYLRFTNEQGQIHCSFVIGKSRVTPLKPVTIPRLELTAAVTSVRISDQLRKELTLENAEEIFWTDSKVVLGYIANESRRFHVYVANRVQEIQDKTSPKQWRYVETRSNPADEASRGLGARDIPNSKWIAGPEFLWKEKGQWPDAMRTEEMPADELSEQDPEVKKGITMATATSVPEPALMSCIEYFSDWFRAKKSVALCIRYIRKLKLRVEERRRSSCGQRPPNLNGRERDTEHLPLTVEELQHAATVIIKATQVTAFKNEIKSLSKTQELQDFQGKSMPRVATLQKLDPFLDQNGILRVGGRIRRANLKEDIKFPILLPRDGHITKLLVQHFHKLCMHQGRTTTLNEIRSNGYWIIGGTSSVSRYILSCIRCRKLRGPAQSQKMSDLPEDRLHQAPPFTYCAVDYFGPWIIKEKRKELKRYGVLFTCMASRAIHLEVAHSLETDSFINALRRFICRRGPIRQMRSDQGTKFVGAKNELEEALNELDHDKIGKELLRNNCDWFSFKMNVPSASHMGGVWERQIRSVRSVLSVLLDDNGTQLDDESLNTFMCEAEAIINSRPLTVDGLRDPDSLAPLTPNHLLTMKSKIVLPPPGNFQDADKYSRRRWRRVQHLANEFWCRWKKEFLQSLQLRQKWLRPQRDLRIDDIVLIKDDGLARNHWQLARVARTNGDEDGHVRTVQLILADPCITSEGVRTNPVRLLERPIHKLLFLMTGSEATEQAPGCIPAKEP